MKTFKKIISIFVIGTFASTFNIVPVQAKTVTRLPGSSSKIVTQPSCPSGINLTFLNGGVVCLDQVVSALKIDQICQSLTPESKAVYQNQTRENCSSHTPPAPKFREMGNIGSLSEDPSSDSYQAPGWPANAQAFNAQPYDENSDTTTYAFSFRNISQSQALIGGSEDGGEESSSLVSSGSVEGSPRCADDVSVAGENMFLEGGDGGALNFNSTEGNCGGTPPTNYFSCAAQNIDSRICQVLNNVFPSTIAKYHLFKPSSGEPIGSVEPTAHTLLIGEDDGTSMAALGSSNEIGEFIQKNLDNGFLVELSNPQTINKTQVANNLAATGVASVDDIFISEGKTSKLSCTTDNKSYAQSGGACTNNPAIDPLSPIPGLPYSWDMFDSISGVFKNGSRLKDVLLMPNSPYLTSNDEILDAVVVVLFGTSADWNHKELRDKLFVNNFEIDQTKRSIADTVYGNSDGYASIVELKAMAYQEFLTPGGDPGCPQVSGTWNGAPDLYVDAQCVLDWSIINAATGLANGTDDDPVPLDAGGQPLWTGDFLLDNPSGWNFLTDSFDPSTNPALRTPYSDGREVVWPVAPDPTSNPPFLSGSTHPHETMTAGLIASEISNALGRHGSPNVLFLPMVVADDSLTVHFMDVTRAFWAAYNLTAGFQQIINARAAQLNVPTHATRFIASMPFNLPGHPLSLALQNLLHAGYPLTPTPGTTEGYQGTITAVGNDDPAAPVVNISNITKANPAVVTTAAAHGLSVGQPIVISGVSGMQQINYYGSLYVKNVLSTTQFELQDGLGGPGLNTNIAYFSPYTSGGIIKQRMEHSGDCYGPQVISNIANITNANPAVLTTTAPHGLSAKKPILVTGVNGMTQINNYDVYVGAILSPTQIELQDGFFGQGLDTTTWGTYTSGGTADFQGGWYPNCHFMDGTTGANAYYHSAATGSVAVGGYDVNGKNPFNYGNHIQFSSPAVYLSTTMPCSPNCNESVPAQNPFGSMTGTSASVALTVSTAAALRKDIDYHMNVVYPGIDNNFLFTGGAGRAMYIASADPAGNTLAGDWDFQWGYVRHDKLFDLTRKILQRVEQQHLSAVPLGMENTAELMAKDVNMWKDNISGSNYDLHYRSEIFNWIDTPEVAAPHNGQICMAMEALVPIIPGVFEQWVVVSSAVITPTATGTHVLFQDYPNQNASSPVPKEVVVYTNYQQPVCTPALGSGLGCNKVCNHGGAPWFGWEIQNEFAPQTNNFKKDAVLNVQ